jgi:hypothetical protein
MDKNLYYSRMPPILIGGIWFVINGAILIVFALTKSGTNVASGNCMIVFAILNFCILMFCFFIIQDVYSQRRDPLEYSIEGDTLVMLFHRKSYRFSGYSIKPMRLKWRALSCVSVSRLTRSINFRPPGKLTLVTVWMDHYNFRLAREEIEKHGVPVIKGPVPIDAQERNGDKEGDFLDSYQSS